MARGLECPRCDLDRAYVLMRHPYGLMVQKFQYWRIERPCKSLEKDSASPLTIPKYDMPLCLFGTTMDATDILITEGVMMLIFGLVFSIVWISILFHMIQLHTRIAEAVERLADIREGEQPAESP